MQTIYLENHILLMVCCLTKLAHLTPGSIFIDKKVIDTKVSTTSTTMFRQHTHEYQIQTYKINLGIIESNLFIGQALTRFFRHVFVRIVKLSFSLQKQDKGCCSNDNQQFEARSTFLT
ncbi:Uncharacterised protein [uncultured archaeon]|nr:Uncharacterised protein [uncultured archaeon]